MDALADDFKNKAAINNNGALEESCKTAAADTPDKKSKTKATAQGILFLTLCWRAGCASLFFLGRIQEMELQEISLFRADTFIPYLYLIGGEAQVEKNGDAEAEGDDDEDDEEEEANGAPTASKSYTPSLSRLIPGMERSHGKTISLILETNVLGLVLTIKTTTTKIAASKKKKKKKNNKKKKKTQTEPPTIPLSVLFPSKIYPEGEICQYKDE
jgi:methionyl aminopeptidase